MKKVIFISMFLLSLVITKAQSSITEWHYYFARNGVDFYSRWKTDDYKNTFYQIKLVNNSSVKKYVDFDFVEYYQGSSYISKVNGAGITLKPYSEAFGERDGLWWTTPKGYSNLSAKITGVVVEDK